MGKKGKSKGKSKTRKPNKHDEISSSKLDLGKQKGDDESGGSEETGKETPPPISWNKERMLEEIIVENVEQLYKNVLEKLVELGYGVDAVRRAMLCNGCIFGDKNALRNIVSYAAAAMKKGHVTDDNVVNQEPSFEDFHELSRFSAQKLINKIVQRENMTKADAIVYLLQNNSDYTVHGSSREHSKSEELHKIQGDMNASEHDMGIKLQENIAAGMQRLSIHSSTSSSSSSKERNVASSSAAAYVAKPCISYLHSMSGESSDDFEFLKSLLTDCPSELSFEDWLRTSTEDAKDGLILNLVEQVEKLENQVKERKEWAIKTVIQTAKKFSADRMELRDLRFEMNPKNRLVKEKELGHSKLNINNQIIKRLQVQKQEMQADIAAQKLTISESEKALSEARKRETKALKKSKEIEKNISTLKRHIAEEKRKVTETGERLQQVNEEIKQAKVRLGQEKEAKAQALALLLEQKRLKRLEEENAKNRLASVRQELAMKHQEMINHRNRLQLELSQLKAQVSSNASSSSIATTSSTQVSHHQRSKQCIICQKNDVCILFLPCAHQVICSDCHEEAYEVLEDQCPCCKAWIQKRVKVYGLAPELN